MKGHALKLQNKAVIYRSLIKQYRDSTQLNNVHLKFRNISHSLSNYLMQMHTSIILVISNTSLGLKHINIVPIKHIN